MERPQLEVVQPLRTPPGPPRPRRAHQVVARGARHVAELVLVAALAAIASGVVLAIVTGVGQ